jgi:SAM-dependent methyltransferase
MKIHYTACPVCGHTHFHEALQAKDHTVSGETFTIIACNKCGFMLTQDVPDADHIGPYYAADAYVSHTDTEDSFFFKVYKWVRNYAIRTKAGWVEKYSRRNKGNLLDVGCGTGYFLAEMRSRGWQITGLEPSETARKVAESKHQLFPQLPQKLYTFPQDTFDVITLWHVLEHVHDLNGYFEAFNKILKQGGVLLIAVPNPESQDAKQYGADWAAWDVPRHLYHFTPAVMKQLADKHGFEREKMHPMWFDAFYVSMLSREIRKQPKWPGAFAGLRSNIHAMTNNSQCSSVVYVLRKR